MILISSLIRPSTRRALFAALLLALTCLSLDRLPGRAGLFFAAAQQNAVAVFNAASFENQLAPDAIAAAFGQYVTQNNQTYTANTVPLPTTLGGVTVKVDGMDVGLFFVGTTQINFLMPSGLSDGAKTVVVTNSDASTRQGTVTVVKAAPGIFTANSGGTGPISGLTTFDGVTFERTANPDGSARQIQPSTQQRPNILVIYGTGWRNAGAGNVRVTIQGVPTQVDFAGPAPGFVGLDQANAIIPPELAGFGLVHVKVIANGIPSNEDSDPSTREELETINIGGQATPYRTQNIAPGQTLNGELTITDQVFVDDFAEPGVSFFLDAYRFTTTAPNTSVAIDLRSSQFDAAVLLFRVKPDDTLELIADDDETGGLGFNVQGNHNALLLTVLPNQGEYIFFASSSITAPNTVGSYTLKLTTDVIQPIAYGAVIGDGVIANTDLQNSAGVFFDLYWFNGAMNDNVRITMDQRSAPPISAVPDPLVLLQSNSGVFLDFDDNSGGGVNALLISRLPAPGIYIILATPYAVNDTGGYRLTLDRTAGLTGGEALRAPGGRELRHQYRTRHGFTKRPLHERTFERIW